MDKWKILWKKYKSLILYAFFGGCTTLVNIISYAVCTRLFGMGINASAIVAWVLAVTFAYLTNRTMVFESEADSRSSIMKEVISFFSCRLLTGGLDLAIMYIFADVMGINDLLIKIISNIIVIVLNYVASKLIIFKHGGQNEERV